jgi:hypothetical protein
MDDKYVPNSELWYFVNDGYRDLSESDQKGILELTEAYSAELWNRYVSATARHLMLMNKSDWPNYAKGEQRKIGPFPDTDDEQSHDVFAEILAQQVPYLPDDKIYFFWMKENAVETTWQIFLRNWPHFFFEDEGPILIVPNHLTAIVFCLENYRIVQRPSVSPQVSN